MKVIFLTMVLAASVLAQEEKIPAPPPQSGHPDLLDKDCLLKWFKRACVACAYVPPECDQCACPRLWSQCTAEDGWASGSTIENKECCKDGGVCFEYVCWGGFWFCTKFCPCPRDDRCCQVKQALLGVDQALKAAEQRGADKDEIERLLKQKEDAEKAVAQFCRAA